MTNANISLIAEQAGENSSGQDSREPDTGLIGLVMLARFHGVAADPDQLAHDFKESGRQFDVSQILLASKQLGLKARKVRTDLSRLPQTPLPALAIDIDGRFLIVARVDDDQVLIHDPRVARPQAVSAEAFGSRWTGELILFASRASLAGELAGNPPIFS